MFASQFLPQPRPRAGFLRTRLVGSPCPNGTLPGHRFPKNFARGAMANGLPVERLYGFSKIPRRPRHPRFCRDSSETTAQTGGLKALARRALARDTNRDRESRYPLEIKTPSETVSFADSDSERSPTGWSDGLGLLNSWGNRPKTTIPSHHSTNTQFPLSMPVSLLTRLAMTREVPRQRAITYEPPRIEGPAPRTRQRVRTLR